MSSSRNHEETIFEAAVQLPPEERAAHLNAVCGDDVRLRERVEQLLKSHDEASGDFLAKPRALVPSKTMVVVPAPVEELLGTMIGRYKLLEKVGEGGFGVVYVAEQREPVKRRVALKIIKLGMDTKQVVARFEVERQALAMMDHPNIAKVFDAGSTEKGRPYFVMELVRGIRITDYCDQNNLATRERLELFAKVCQAIQHAHQKGIIHRDIKPSNILITLHDGVPVPKVIDFGIAKATQGELTEHTVYTQLQQFIGTPAYMSPEQAEMSGLDIDTRSDIYALGVLLYELLTGRTPFDQKELLSAGVEGMRRMIREQEPQRPSTRVSSLQGEDRTITAKRHGLEAPKLVHLLQGDLDWIVMKCLEKDRTRRYETANGVAMDLQRHLNSEPVVARPASVAYRLQKFARRNKLAFSAGTAVAVALCLGVVASTWQAVRATREQHIADRERSRAQTEAKRADTNAVAEARQRHMAEQAVERTKQALSKAMEIEADRLAREGGAAKALAHFARALRIDPANRIAGQRIVSLLNQKDFPLPMVGRPANISFSPLEDLPGYTRDLRRYGQYTNGNSLAVLDTKDGHAVGKLLPLQEGPKGFGFSYDGTRLVVVMTNRAIFWECESGRKLSELDGKLESFSPDGNFAVISDGVVAVPSGQLLFSLPPRSGRGQARFSPDGQRLAFVSESTALAQVLFTTNGQPVAPGLPTIISGAIPFVRFTPEGRRLLGSGSHGDVEVWDLVQNRQTFPTLHHGYSVHTMDCSADGRLLATGTRSGRAHIWNLLTGQPAREPCQSSETVAAACLAPDGSWLSTRGVAASGTNFEAKLYASKWWDLRVGRAVPIRMVHPSQVWRAAYSPDGSLVLTVCQDGFARVWSARTGELAWPPINHGGGVKVALFNRDATLLATGASGGDVRLWETSSGKELKLLGRHESRISALAFSPDGRFLASGSEGESLKVWELKSGTLAGQAGNGERTLRSPNHVMDIKFDRLGQRLVAAYHSGHAEIFEAPALRRVADLAKNLGVVFQASYSPDGQWLVTASGNDAARLWNARTGEGPLAMYPHESGVYAADFSADGRRLATASYDHTARIWETATGRPVTEPLLHQHIVLTGLFSPDDRTLITACGDGSAVVWDAETGRALSEKFQHLGGVNSACFSPDGRHVLTAGRDGIAAIYDWVPVNDHPPLWLAELAEAVGGYRLTEAGVAEQVEDAAQILVRLRQQLTNAAPADAVARWGQWYVADRWTRAISPYAAISVQNHAARLAHELDLASLEEALELGSRDPIVYQKLAGLIEATQPETAALYRRLAVELGGIAHAPNELASAAGAAQSEVAAATPPPNTPVIEGLDPYSLEELLRHEGQWVRVRGKIVRYLANYSGLIHYLNFTEDYHRGLSLVFKQNEHTTQFSAKSLAAYVDQTVVAEGKLITYRGVPEIELTSTNQIKTLVGPVPSVAASAEVPAPAAVIVASPADTNAIPVLDGREGVQLLKREGQQVKVRGRLVRFGAANSARIYYLNFTENYRAGLSLVFFEADNPSEFRPELLRAFINKTVLVEGKIETYLDRPQIRLRSLADLKIVEAPDPAQKAE